MEAPDHPPGNFFAEFNERAVLRLDELRDIVNNRSSQIADARGAGRFTGEEAEPREGMRSGHMPGARNVPVFSLSENGYLKTVDELKDVLESAGIDTTRPVVTTCGSGVTAAVITMALQSMGNTQTRLYDGSWSEWGSKRRHACCDRRRLVARARAPLRAVVTYLEQVDRPAFLAPMPVNLHVALMKQVEMPLHFYRYLQYQTGREWHWVARLRLPDEALSKIIHDPKTTIHVLYINGAPSGFFELHHPDSNTVNLEYFGIMSHAHGRGLGPLVSFPGA